MNKLKMIKIIKKNKRKLAKLFKKLPFGENFIQDFMIKMEIIFKDPYSKLHLKSELLRKHLMIIYFK
jgi:hypothetical protein